MSSAPSTSTAQSLVENGRPIKMPSLLKLDSTLMSWHKSQVQVYSQVQVQSRVQVQS